jgi:hypothetical protein
MFIFIGLIFATICMKVQANTHAVFINDLCENSGNETTQLDRTLPIYKNTLFYSDCQIFIAA